MLKEFAISLLNSISFPFLVRVFGKNEFVCPHIYSITVTILTAVKLVMQAVLNFLKIYMSAALIHYL